MFSKVAALIVCLGLIACMMLAIRQQRVQAAHQLAKSQTSLAKLDQDVLRLRSQIAAKLTPDQIEQAGTKLGRLMPLTLERYQQLVQRETDAEATAALTLGPSTGHVQVP